MTTIVTRSGKGSPLTHNEVDANFTNLNNDKVESTNGALTNPTLPSGTANGVTYLNGSKVLTTGNALTFDGANLLVGSSTQNGFKLGVVTASAASTTRNALQLSDYTTTDINFTLNNNVGGMFAGNGGSLAFGYNNTTEAMRLTSTGLGIGTSSPATRLDVNGTQTFRDGSDTRTGTIKFASGAFQLTTTAASEITFSTSSTERMRLDASGNLGIGTSSPAFKADIAGQTRSTAYVETKTVIAASAIDLTAGNYFTKTISGSTTFTTSGTPATGNVASFVLDLTNGGSAAVTWWAGVKWASGTAPTLTASGRDVLGFFTHDGGTTWNGFLIGKAMA